MVQIKKIIIVTAATTACLNPIPSTAAPYYFSLSLQKVTFGAGNNGAPGIKWQKTKEKKQKQTRTGRIS